MTLKTQMCCISLGISNFSNPRVEHLAPSLQCEFVAAQNRHCVFTSDHIYHVHVGGGDVAFSIISLLARYLDKNCKHQLPISLEGRFVGPSVVVDSVTSGFSTLSGTSSEAERGSAYIIAFSGRTIST